MRCECGTRIQRKAKYCSGCGAVVEVSEKPTAVAEAKDYAADVLSEGRTVVKEAGRLAKEGMKSDMGKSVATCAALGAIIAIPIPFVGSAFGASVGAVIGAIRKL
jgi:hypothetical protein